MTVLQEPVQAAIWQALNHYAYRDAVFLAERLYAEGLRKGNRSYLVECLISRKAMMILLLNLVIQLALLFHCWDMYIGEKPDPDQTFKLTSLQNFSNCLPSSCTTLVSNHSLSHRQPETVLTETPQDTIELNRLNLESSNSKYSLNTDSSVSYIDSAVISPDTVPLGTGTSILSKQVQNKPKTGRSLLGGPAALSPLTPSFGILPLETPSPGDGSYLQNYTNTSSVIDVPSTGAPSKKTFCVLQSVARIGQTGTKSVFSQSGNSREVTPILVAQTQSSGPQTSTTPQVLSPTITSPPNALPRRSSRLFTSDSSTTKENSKKLKMKFPPKIPNRKTKSKTNKGGITQPNINDSLEITKLDSSIISEGKISTITPQIQAFNLQKAAAEGLMSLLREMGKGYLALCSYNCKEAINILSHLPSHHYNTGWVLCQIGRAYFELSEYMQAERIFSEVRRIENYRVEGMEIYSTTLWHLQKDVALSVLSKDLTDMDKNSPEAWCAAGNCFSLQREHDIAIKFFQRAIQVDPNYAYAYTLLGHEFVLTEELDKALACFRNAIRVNPRHYNAWYGLGMIYYKQEKFSLAEMHFQKALDINPQSSVLLCHIGVVQHALKKSEKALDTLNKAIVIDPKNPLCKFHRASVLFANEKYKSALQELEELKQIVPKESLVYFLIGKVYKKLGQTHLALMNFSWAMDLDPKGANNQIKEAIDKRYLPDDEEPITQEEQIMGTDESQESSMTDADDTQLHAAESDEF
ncbi:cell division cycle protein 27 homolog isoform X11 [Eumetopias jubatus]|uniref:Cell division cycle protein 27 homolog n=2 Tax=Callorhinus ursinus TaxID=34884 RepID=A0A3Q7QJF6_CALUR|nr:cell division cycle protein 27 homolog isoform X11 [Callorhinus ursinus]XP_025745888.1 cell division cycle protein 27 homolog isoform X11 [Callorhinus ursinus]XP_027943305.1 cell division cycle protein 27 homolog isoform X11 [Eumetopias jubatus]